MPTISFSEAARIAGVNPSTIHRAVKKGRLSAKMLDNGQKVIDPSELQRVFPSERPRKSTHGAMPLHAINTVLAAKNEAIELLHAQIRNLSEERIDLRKRLDESEKERRRTVLFIEDQRTNALRPWWKKLFS